MAKGWYSEIVSVAVPESQSVARLTNWTTLASKTWSNRRVPHVGIYPDGCQGDGHQ